jgi:hypothetical protein
MDCIRDFVCTITNHQSSRKNSFHAGVPLITTAYDRHVDDDHQKSRSSADDTPISTRLRYMVSARLTV